MGSLRAAVTALLITALILAALGLPAPTGATRQASLPSDRTPAEAAAPVIPHPNTTAVLTLTNDPTRTTVGTARLDVAGAMAVDAGSIRGRFVRLQIEHRYAAAETAAERRSAVANSTDSLAGRTATLLAREHALRENLARGERSPADALGGFAAIDATATELDRATAVINEQLEAEGGPVSRSRLGGIRADLVPLHGPVRDRVGRSVAGRSGPMHAVLLSDGSGLVVATVDGGEYVRSAAVPEARNATLENTFASGPELDVDAARERASELYPWAFENLVALSIGTFGGPPALRHAAVYAVTIDHKQGLTRQGDLVAYLDGGTTNVFREVQYLSASELPRGSGVVARTGSLRLQVNMTRPGGPLAVNVTRDGRPVDATLYVNGARVGTVGGDGRRWVVGPPGAVNITAVEGGATVSATAQV